MFDTVNREILFIILGKLGCPPKFLGIIRSYTHAAVYARLAVVSEFTQSFKYNSGVKKGGRQISSNTFWPLRSSLTLARVQENQVYLQCTEKTTLRWRSRRLKVKSKVLTEFVREAQYADNIAIFSDTLEGLQSLLTSYNDVAKKMGLPINTVTTETMCIGNLTEFFIDGTKLANVSRFVPRQLC